VGYASRGTGFETSVMTALDHAVVSIVGRCLGITVGEETLVIVDPGTREIGESLRNEASAKGADAMLVVMDARATDGTEPPASIAAALATCDVYIAATTRSLSHTTARKRATDAGARGATMPGVTPEMLARVMAVNFDALSARTYAVTQLLTSGTVARLTCPLGTDATFDLSDRDGIADDGDLTARGAFGNLPCGEAFIAPLTGEGRIVASSFARLGLSDEPVTLMVRDGRLISAVDGLGPEFMRLLEAHGELGTNLAELGVGTNEHATLTGNVLEDEKILGTVHVAFGASAAIGGTVSVPIHLDAVVTAASLTVDGVVVLEQGRLVLDDRD
jgi:leucyl aminopeptidase (aminopeptidase T)